MSDGVISFNKICGRLCVEMTGHLASPLSIGSGEEEHSDSDVVFRASGEPYIPGSSLAGALLEYSAAIKGEEETKKMFGMPRGGVPGSRDDRQSRIFVYDARIGQAEVGIRDGVKLNEDKTASHMGKYELQFVERNAPIKIRIEMIEREDCFEKAKSEITGRERTEEIEQVWDRERQWIYLWLKGFESGELRLGASTTISQYVLPPVLASFIKKFPEIKVSLLNGNSRDIEQALREGKITLGLIEGTAHQSTLHYTPFMRDELVVVAHTGSSLAAYDEISLEQLRTLPLVLRENGSGTLDVVEAALAEHQVKLSQLNVVLQMGSTESIKLFLENSEALGIVSIRAVTRELMSGRLKVIEVEGFRAERMFAFAEPQGQNGGVEESFIRYACQNWR